MGIRISDSITLPREGVLTLVTVIKSHNRKLLVTNIMKNIPVKVKSSIF